MSGEFTLTTRFTTTGATQDAKVKGDVSRRMAMESIIACCRELCTDEGMDEMEAMMEVSEVTSVVFRDVIGRIKSLEVCDMPNETEIN